ncbi:Uncharacterised protein [Citrobacter koseri]|nr:Uncharacterised protein [Citrobacter koseri]
MICQWLASITASSALFIQPCHSVSAGVQRAGLPAAYTMRQGTGTLSPGVCPVSKRSRCAMLSSHVSAACSVRFCDTIPAVLARLIKSASWLSGVCWSKCSAAPEAFVLRLTGAAGPPGFRNRNPVGTRDRLTRSEPARLWRTGAVRRPPQETRHTTNLPAHKGREAAGDGCTRHTHRSSGRAWQSAAAILLAGRKRACSARWRAAARR